MNRIMVIGCCGAGKSTFSKKLHSIAKLPLIHLDQYYWKPDWVATEPPVWEETVRQLAQQQQWIIDGNYGGTMDIRISRADTIIWLDMPRWKCLYRVIKRALGSDEKVRSDMAEGCRKRLDWSFIQYVSRFHRVQRPEMREKIKEVGEKKTVYHLTSQREMDNFLASYMLSNTQ